MSCEPEYHGNDDRILPVQFGQLKEQHPEREPEVIHGLIRQGETCNIVASPKVGKSWLAYNLALSITTGGDWLQKFPAVQGRVLLIDNELKPSELTYRLSMVADAMQIPVAEVGDMLDVVSLRGRLLTIEGIGPRVLHGTPRCHYAAIIIDAKYRVESGEENSNTDQRNFYNLVDQYAEQTGAAWFLICHSSKGSQADKSITDVGAGGGAQSRAADTHLILREHQEEGCIVLEAAVRSNGGPEPLVLKWSFPLFEPQDDLDATALKKAKTPGQAKQEKMDNEGCEKIRKAYLTTGQGEMTRGQIRKFIGGNAERVNRLIAMMLEDGRLEFIGTTKASNGVETDVFRITDKGKQGE